MQYRKVSRSRGFGSTFKITLAATSFLILFSIVCLPRNLSRLLSASSFSEFKQSFQSVPTNRDRKSLPDFTNGGIIVFYHIYKTGGSTVGKLLHELAQEEQNKYPHHWLQDKPTYEAARALPGRLFFTMIRKRIDWEKDCLTTLDIAQNQSKLLLLELHVEHPGPDFPSLVELAPTLKKWRAEAERRGVGFFAFTLLREPVAHALSFFNFFHVGHSPDRPPPTKNDHDFWNPFRPLQPTEENFLRSYYANNRQCRMLHSDPQATQGAPHDLVWSRKEILKEDLAQLRRPCRVDLVDDVYFNALDWVGTTENLQNETLPLLTKLVVNDTSIGRNNVPFKVFAKNPNGFLGLKKYNLSEAGMETILERTKLDRRLYAEVTRQFRLTDLGWNYQSPVDG